MRRTTTLISLFSVALLSFAGGFASVQAAPEKPNIVIFLVDDMGVMDTSVPFLTDEAGKPKRYPLNDYYRTPSMERLAAQGIRFNNFYAMSVCSPTRCSIQTGQNAARHHVTNWINPERNNAGPKGPPDWDWEGLDSHDVTLARTMHDAGYRTMHVGKGHFGANGFEGANPLNLGFDKNVGGDAFGAPGSYYGTNNYTRMKNKKPFHSVPGLEKYHGTDTFLTEALTIEANALLDDAVKAGEPFFLYFPEYAVHAPFDADARFADHYKDSGKSEQAQAFATLIEGMDKSLGDLMDHLEELGVAENTLIFFMGDNGTDAPLGDEHAVACAAPLRGKKGAHYEGGMRVPFIAAWAKPNPENPFQKQLGIPAGVIQNQQASVEDLFPTILAFTGIENPADHPVDGRRLDTLLTGKPDPTRTETFLMHYPHSPHRSDYWSSYRDGDWKVIYHYFPTEVSGNSHYQLFNLKDDPFEQDDLSKEKPEELKRMMEELMSELESHNAQYPVDPETSKRVLPQMP